MAVTYSVTVLLDVNGVQAGERLTLPDETIVYPGHDYNGRVSSTIGEEKTFNERLNLSISKHAFVEVMNNRHVPPPAKMEVAVPANMRAGRTLESSPNRRSTSRVP